VATLIKMPQLGMTMTEAKILRWVKKQGEAVSKGDVVAEIETDKLNAEVEANGDGVIRRIVAAEGTTVPVVGLMGVIGAPDEPEAAIDAALAGAGTRATASAPPAAPAVPSRAGAATPAPAPVVSSVPAATAAAPAADVRASPMAKRLAADLGVDLGRVQATGPGGRIVEADVRAAAEAARRPSAGAAAAAAPPTPAGAAAVLARTVDGHVRASPLAKRLAHERGLDLRSIRGTGPDGRIVERDVLAAAAAPPTMAAPAPAIVAAAPAAGLTRRETVAVDGIRRVIAERMYQSLQQAAQLTVTTEADATALVELRQHLVPAAKVYGHRPPTYTDLIITLVARTLESHPLLNASLVTEAGAQQIACWQEINVGVAVNLDRGLIVPVIKDANRKPLQAISLELGDLAERARANRLGPDQLQGGTFTITNLGPQEIDAFTPVINPPQSAILGVGRIAKKPSVYEDQLAIRQMVTLSLTFDHRIVDGAPAATFLRDVKRAIEAPSIGG
jgi:pyruvate dehydrogenase E2 component (dihydrolipoamide acetyltransferase)